MKRWGSFFDLNWFLFSALRAWIVLLHIGWLRVQLFFHQIFLSLFFFFLLFRVDGNAKVVNEVGWKFVFLSPHSAVGRK